MPTRTSDGQRPTGAEAERHLRHFIDKFEPKHRTLIRAARRVLRGRFPNADELVYDNYNFFVIGYTPTGRPSDAIVSIAAGASGVGVCFIRGASLPDPKRILLGSGKQTRFIRIPSATILSQPAVKALLVAAIAHASPPRRSTRGTLVIQSVSAKQRPRRKTPAHSRSKS